MAEIEFPFRMRADRRAFQNDAAKKRFIAAVAVMREAQIAMARALVEIEDSEFVSGGRAFLREIGERYGGSPRAASPTPPTGSGPMPMRDTPQDSRDETNGWRALSERFESPDAACDPPPK